MKAANRIGGVLAVMLWAQLGWAGSPSAVAECLEAYDLPCAEEAWEALPESRQQRRDGVAVAARLAFYSGRYAQAAELLEQAVEEGWPDRFGHLDLYRSTAEVMQGWVEARQGRLVVRFRPGLDAVLVEDAIEILAQAEERLAPLLGGAPPGPVLLELHPTGRSFVAASPFSRAEVQNTGVVALSKWSRLLVTSPRARSRGYGWRDTIAHEYIHLVVSYHSDDKAPVWLQEGIAKLLDRRWRDGGRFELGTREQSLLHHALENDDLVTFEEMNPSLALLPSAERAALAYAQLATLVEVAFQHGGDELLHRALPAVQDGTEPRVALAEAAGFDAFEDLERAWLEHLRGMRLADEDMPELPTVLDGADELEVDPVLAHREDLARWVRLGDLLLERERPKAALVEYGKARAGDDRPSPLLANRIARAHAAQGDTNEARAVLERSLKHYPDFTLTHKALGSLHQERGAISAAIDAYRQAAELNPFDPEVQGALATLLEERGDPDAARHARYLRMLRRGGADADQAFETRLGEVVAVPLHQEETR